MTKLAAILIAIIIAVIAIVLFVFAFILEKKQIYFNENLRPGDKVWFYHGEQKIPGTIESKNEAGCVIVAHGNLRKYAVNFPNILRD